MALIRKETPHEKENKKGKKKKKKVGMTQQIIHDLLVLDARIHGRLP